MVITIVGDRIHPIGIVRCRMDVIQIHKNGYFSRLGIQFENLFLERERRRADRDKRRRDQIDVALFIESIGAEMFVLFPLFRVEGL